MEEHKATNTFFGDLNPAPNPAYSSSLGHRMGIHVSSQSMNPLPSCPLSSPNLLCVTHL